MSIWTCDICDGENVEVILPIEEKKKMSDASKPVNLVYKTTTLKCRDCGFRVTF